MIEILERLAPVITALSLAITAMSLLLALITYFYQKSQDKKVEAIEQVSFFRKEIISRDQEFVSMVWKARGEDYKFKKVRLDEPTIEYVRKHYSSEAKEQNDVVKELKTLWIQTDILNRLEEFALRVIHFKTHDYEALNPVKSPFIEVVELHAVVLLMQRDVFTGGESFSSTVKLYSLWKDSIDRRSPDERMVETRQRLNLR